MIDDRARGAAVRIGLTHNDKHTGKLHHFELLIAGGHAPENGEELLLRGGILDVKMNVSHSHACGVGSRKLREGGQGQG